MKHYFVTSDDKFQKVKLVKLQANKRSWLVKDTITNKEFTVSSTNLLPKPQIEQQAPSMSTNATYIWYKQVKFAPPWSRVKLVKMQNDKCTVVDLQTKEKIRNVNANMLVPKPQVHIQTIDPAVEEAFNSQNLIVLAKSESGYGQVREIKPDKARLLIEFPQNQSVVWSVSDTKLVVIDKRKDVANANKDITLYLIGQLMQNALDEWIEEYFTLMQEDDAKATTQLFERLIHPKRYLLLEQRNIVHDSLIVPWLNQASSPPFTNNIWLGCMYDIDEAKKTWSSDAVFRQVMQRLKKITNDGESVQIPTYDMRNIYEFLKFLRKGRNKLSKFLKTLDESSFIWYTIQLFNDIFGDDGMQYQSYLAEWPVEDGDTLTDSYYTWYELNKWKADVLKTKGKNYERVIEHAFDVLYETYAKCIKNYGELDEQAVDFDLQKEEILIGDLRYIADYKRVVNVMREILDDIDAAGKSDDIGVDLEPVEQAFKNVIELAK